MFVVGSVLRLAPVFVLGRRFSGLVAIQEGHELVTGGLYRVIRHPSYLGLLLGLFGWALVFRSAIGVLVSLLLIPPLVARMNSEEALLESEFGEQYADYRRRRLAAAAVPLLNRKDAARPLRPDRSPAWRHLQAVRIPVGIMMASPARLRAGSTTCQSTVSKASVPWRLKNRTAAVVRHPRAVRAGWRRLPTACRRRSWAT